MKHCTAISILFVLIALGFLSYYLFINWETIISSTIIYVPEPKLRQCPTYWYLDRMPYVHDPNNKSTQISREYVIIEDRGRVEMDEMDWEWVKGNCLNLRRSTVY